ERARFPNDPGLDRLQLLHEAAHVDDEVADHGEVGKRLDHDRPGQVVAEERGAAELGGSVHVHPATAADAHAAGPAVAHAAVDVSLDPVQPVENDHVVLERDLVRLLAGLSVATWIEAGDRERDRLGCQTGPPSYLKRSCLNTFSPGAPSS